MTNDGIHAVLYQEVRKFFPAVPAIFDDVAKEQTDRLVKVLDEHKFLSSEAQASAWERCPEHGPSCVGSGCCCTDKHQEIPS